ncbi:MAG: IS3 family transposase [Thermoplasmatales archaeon]
MMVLEDLKQEMSLRNISRISGISLSGYYYRYVNRHIQRPDPSTMEKIRGIASERTTYGYRRVWAILRNSGTHVNQKTVRKVLEDNNLSLPASKHRGRTKSRNLFSSQGSDQLWETDITYIPTEYGMTCLMCI